MPFENSRSWNNAINLFCFSKSHKTQKYSLYSNCIAYHYKHNYKQQNRKFCSSPLSLYRKSLQSQLYQSIINCIENCKTSTIKCLLCRRECQAWERVRVWNGDLCWWSRAAGKAGPGCGERWIIGWKTLKYMFLHPVVFHLVFYFVPFLS